jgi:hypothetical protein
LTAPPDHRGDRLNGPHHLLSNRPMIPAALIGCLRSPPNWLEIICSRAGGQNGGYGGLIEADPPTCSPSGRNCSRCSYRAKRSGAFAFATRSSPRWRFEPPNLGLPRGKRLAPAADATSPVPPATPTATTATTVRTNNDYLGLLY